MVKNDLNILILEDDTSDLELIKRALKKGEFDFDSRWVKDKDEFEQALQTYHPDLILADFRLPAFNAQDAYKMAHKKVPNVPFIIVSGNLEDSAALQAMREGTTDYVLKGNLLKLPMVVKRAINESRDHQGRIEAENQLKINFERIETILKATKIITWEWDLTKNTVQHNDSGADIYGSGKENSTIDFEDLKDKIHPDDLPNMLKGLNAHFEGKTDGYLNEHRIKHKNGEWVWVLDQGKITEWDDGKPVKLLGILKDISRRKIYEESLNEANKVRDRSLALLDTVYKTVPVGLTILDQDFKIISANKALGLLTGLSSEDHFGKELKEVIPEIAIKSESFLKRVSKSGRPILNFEISGRTPAFPDMDKHVLISFYPVKCSDYQVIGIAINDITQLRESEEARHESEMRFHQMEENVNAIIWIMEAGTNKLQYISPSYERIWSLTIADLFDDPFSFLEGVHPEDQEFVETATLKLLACENPEQFDIEFRIISPDNKIRWFNDKGFAVRDKKGNIKSYGGLMQDITKRKIAEQELMEIQNMLLETQNIVHLGSFEWIIPEYKVVWSDELYRIFGYQPGEIPTSMATYLNFSYPKDNELVNKAINNAIINKKDFELEHRILLRDGAIRVVSLIVKVKLDSNLIPVHVIGLVQDITDKKQAEDVAQRFGRIMDSSMNELYIISEDTNKFIQASRSALQNLGYQLEELQELSLLDVKVGLSHEKLTEIMQTLTSGEQEGMVYEAVHKRKDGTTYPAEARLQYLRSETPPVFLAEVSDISERKKAQQARYEGQEMERKRIAMEIHDGIGQMLIAIKQRVINLEYNQIDQEEWQERIDEIDNILSMTIEEARRTSSNLAPIVLKKMGIEDAIEMLCMQTGKINNIKILFDRKGPKIRANENILLAVYRILQEGLNNVVKHSNASQAKVQFFRDDQNISLIVADNGSGFDLNGNIRKGSNGLSNMRERASLVNGEFYIETKVRSGTYIKLDIPLKENEE